MKSQRIIARVNLIIFLIISISPTAFSKESKTVGRFPQSKVKSLEPCEINFLKFINGSLPAQVPSGLSVNLWDELFEPDDLVSHLSSMTSKRERLKVLEELSQLVDKDKVFVDNLSNLVNQLYQKNIISEKDIRRIFLYRDFGSSKFFWSSRNKVLSGQVEISPIKTALIETILSSNKLSKARLEEYRNILLNSNLTDEEIQIAIDSGLVLVNSSEYLEQFRNYIEYLNVIQKFKIKKALKHINDIYDFDYTPSFYRFSATLPPHEVFLLQQAKVKAYETRRIEKHLRKYKLAERDKVSQELRDLAYRESMGEYIPRSKKRKLERKLKSIKLPESLKKRAITKAVGEARILRKLLTGCSGGKNPKVTRAKNKFKRFKTTLTLVSTPFFYITKNIDKENIFSDNPIEDQDPYFYEKLGFEIVSGFVFTYVANKIITNTSTSFITKFFEGYVKFGLLDGVINGFGYDQLFGAHEKVRYFQRLYNDKVPESELDRELNKLIASDTFEQDIRSLFELLEENSKVFNMKNTLEKIFGSSGFNSLDDDYKITQEDLESEEAREVMMELLAERMYLQNMGDWRFFQTGSEGADRWLFYRARNLGWDFKSLAVNLAIFQVMCKEPFGKVGSWLAVFAILVGDSMLSGDLTYQLRRDLINQ